MKVLVAHSGPTLCHPTDCNPPGSSVLEIFQAIIMEWVAMPFSSLDLPDSGIEPECPALQADSFIIAWEISIKDRGL